MDAKLWTARLRYLFGAAGLACVVAAALLCVLGLELGTTAHRVTVAAGIVVLAALAWAVLKLERVGRNGLLLMLLPIGAAMLVRVLCLDYASLDYQNFLSHWYGYFKENGGFAAMAGSVGDYNVPYLYFMAAISYLNVPDLYLIKLFSLLADVALAWGGLRLARTLRGERAGDAVPLAAFTLLLFLPTVVLNGAYWGQCDAIYGALTLHALASLLKGRNKSSVALLAVAFSFKLQTIFLIPLWGVLWLARKVRLRELLIFPLTYVITIVPALLMGKPLADILGVYFEQMGEYPRLTLNAPSVFQFIPYDVTVNDTLMSRLGIIVAAVLVLALLGVGLWLGRRMNGRIAMAMAAVLAIGVPFFLPHMHERYFFLADVICLCWACVNRRRIPVALLVCGSSLASYLVYLRLKYNAVISLFGARFVMGLEALAMLAALVCSVAILIREIGRREAADKLN